MGNQRFNRSSDLLQMTSNIVAAQLTGSNVSRDDIPDLIDTVFNKLQSLSNEAAASNLTQKPAVPVEDSVTPDHIICLEDGKAFKMLKKHLSSHYSLTPEEYRVKWGLPADYPMVAPNYAVKRQRLAKESGLGKRR